MDFETAKQRVEQYVNRAWATSEHSVSVHGPLIVVNHIEKPYGWIFFYATKKYAETRDFKHAVVGNGPIIFDRRTEQLHQLGTATRPEQQIRDWEAANWRRDS